jgi:hypothetical protein
MKKYFYLVIILMVAISCNKGVGCPNDFYNNFNKKQATTKSMNSNKPPKQKKNSSASNRMGPQ